MTKRGRLATGPVTLVELEKPNRMKRSVGRAAKSVDELVTTDRALLTLRSGLQEVRAQLAEPMRLDADPVAESLTIVMEIEAANHSLYDGVVRVRVPSTAIGLAVDDA